MIRVLSFEERLESSKSILKGEEVDVGRKISATGRGKPQLEFEFSFGPNIFLLKL